MHIFYYGGGIRPLPGDPSLFEQLETARADADPGEVVFVNVGHFLRLLLFMILCVFIVYC